MNAKAKRVQRTYLTLLLCNTLAASLIWGINTIFLLDAGLSNFEAFAANAFFTAGMLVFEIPTGVMADLKGRRLSYLLGTITLAASTLLYLFMWQVSAPFWAWAVASALLGLGFTFFSGAVEAWLVDALRASGFTGRLESVFAKGEIIRGIAMLGGSVAGGVIAQVTNLGVPYLLRAVILLATFVLAYFLMRDIGFTPSANGRTVERIKRLLHQSVNVGLKRPTVRWVLLTSPFFMGAMVYAFYAMQPYLLQLYGDPHAYGIAGLAAALVAGAQIIGGAIAPHLSRLFKRRSTVLLVGVVISACVMAVTGLAPHFWVVVTLLAVWSVLFSVIMPVKQAYLNAVIPTQQRATILSFDSLLGSAGGVVGQPLFGKAADMWGYAQSYVVAAAFQAFAIPFALGAKRHALSRADAITDTNFVQQQHR
ncbi:MAG TPA: MFS transporter [Candidatus Saccharimonadales bacterium]|nr:MFS transporter [Candidatus Saccharimonadales bacterium]